MSDTTGQKAAGQDEAAADQDGKAEEPVDDVVTTRHAITTDGAELRYTVTAGRVVLRQEGHTDDKFDGAAANIEFAYHEAGHMMYVHEPSRLAQSARLAAFVRGGHEAR